MNTNHIDRYTVTLATLKGLMDIEVPTTLGAGAAGRRAHMAIVALNQGYGDLDQVTIKSVTLGTFAQVDAAAGA